MPRRSSTEFDVDDDGTGRFKDELLAVGDVGTGTETFSPAYSNILLVVDFVCGTSVVDDEDGFGLLVKFFQSSLVFDSS